MTGEITPKGPELVVVHNGQQMSYAADTTVRIGRDPEAEVCLVDGRISRDHASLAFDGHHWVLTNRGRHGCYLHGQRHDYLVIDHPLAVRVGNPENGFLLNLSVRGDTDFGLSRDEQSGAPPFGHGSSDSATPAGPGPGPAVYQSTVAIQPGMPLPPMPPPGALLGGQPSPAPSGVPGVPGSGVASAPGQAGGVYEIHEGRPLTIGRALDNDVVVPDLTVSQHHAEIRRSGTTYEVVDRQSRNGVYIDGQRVPQARLTEGQILSIGRFNFELERGRLKQYVDVGAGLFVDQVAVDVDGGKKRILDSVCFTLEPGQVLAVVGTSGAGKSTLLKALNGFSPATSGAVWFNGQHLYSSLDQLRYRIGYVPQDDILHTGLTLRRALRYSASLRFADDVSAAERNQRVDEVLAELKLSDRADLPIAKLSGGQRKRASVALELLTRPSLLFLDEPTSGLDPGNERSLMQLLRDLADEGGRTIIVITHSTQSLDLCDRVLFLAPGGKEAYYGPPAESLEHFGNKDYSEVFQRLDGEKRQWREEFERHPNWGRYVAAPARKQIDYLRRPQQQSQMQQPSKRQGAGPIRQFSTLVARNAAVLMTSKVTAIMLALQAPLLGLLILGATGIHHMDCSEKKTVVGPGGIPMQTGDDQVRLLIGLVVVAAAVMGLINASREIVKELPIYLRERTVGLSLPAYLSSKFAVLSVVAIVQAGLLSLVAVYPQGPQPQGTVMPSVFLEVTFVLFIATLCSVGIGLFLSALVSSESAALTMIPVMFVVQVLTADVFLRITDKPPLAQLAWLTPSYWGVRAVAASADMRNLELRCDRIYCSDAWNHQASNVVVPVFVMLLLTAVCGLLAAWLLKRRDPIKV